MKTKNEITVIGNLILKYYKEPIKEKYELPEKTKKVKRIIEVEEPVEKTKIVSVINPYPGIAIFVLGAIAAIFLFQYNYLYSNVSVILFMTGLVGGALALFFIKKKKTIKTTVVEKVKKEIEEEIVLPPEYGFREVTRKYSIRSVGKINLNFFLLNINDGSLIIPESNAVKKNRFTFPTIEKYKTFKKEDAKIEKETENIPYILEGDTEEQPLDIETTYGKKVFLRGYEKDLNSYFQNTEAIFSKLKKINFEFPIIKEEGLPEYLKKKAKNKVSFGVADHFYSLIHSEQGYEFEEQINLWLERWDTRVKLMNNLRIYSLVNDISPEFYELGQISQYTSFNFYCPSCTKEIQEDILSRDYSVQSDSTPSEIYFSQNTKCKFDPVENTWTCPVCEKTFKQPIPVHKIMDEIFLPVYDKLMEENKVEREKHHSEMRKSEIEMRYKMKEELEKIYFEHISGIFELQSSMDKMQAEIEGESEAIVYMEEVARKQKNIHSKVINNILQENEEMKSEIKKEAELVAQRMEDFKNAELSTYEQKMNVLSKAKRIEDERRHKEIVGTLEKGFQKVEDAVNRNTEAVKETTKAVQENTEAVKETTKAVQENTKSVNELKDETKKGFVETNKNLKRTNAILIATAEEQGINLRNDSFINVGKRFKYFKEDVKGALTGRNIIETEIAKDN